MFAIITVIVLIIIAVFTQGARYDTRAYILGAASARAPPVSQKQRHIAREYAKFRPSRERIPFHEYCFPSKFRVQRHQGFLAEYIADKDERGETAAILAFHGIGSGKTCAAISVAERIEGSILVLLPASLIGNFRGELRSACIPEERRSDARLDEKYIVSSFNRFVAMTAQERAKLEPKLVIIDEVHNLRNAHGRTYSAILAFIRERPRMHVLALSATPIFDNSNELISLLRLLRIDIESLDDPGISNQLSNAVSYFAGAPEYTLPRVEFQRETCEMSAFQTRWYRAEVYAEKLHGRIKEREITDSFYANSRGCANIVFPHGMRGMEGLGALSEVHITDNLEKYSCKFATLIHHLRRGRLSFVYTNFAGTRGIMTLAKCLQAFGWRNFSRDGPGQRRYAIWDGHTPLRERMRIARTFNDSTNDDAGQIQVIIGSPATREGVSFLRVRQVHVLEPYWNNSRMAQIYGRAIRFCSHRSLPSAERVVRIYLYVAVVQGASRNARDPDDSIDAYILDIAERKRKNTDNVLKLMQNAAIDRALFAKKV